MVVELPTHSDLCSAATACPGFCPSYSEWSQVIPNARLCKALIDRLTDRAHIITTGADSYRFRRTTAQRKPGKA